MKEAVVMGEAGVGLLPQPNVVTHIPCGWVLVGEGGGYTKDKRMANAWYETGHAVMALFARRPHEQAH